MDEPSRAFISGTPLLGRVNQIRLTASVFTDAMDLVKYADHRRSAYGMRTEGAQYPSTEQGFA